MEEMMKNVFQLDIPLKGSPLRAIHTYLIVGGERSLLVDTAFNTDECEQAMLAQMEQLGVCLDTTDIFLTHMHVDHAGLISRLKTPNNRIFASAPDKAHIDAYQTPERWSWLDANSRWAGVPGEDALKPEAHVAYSYRPSHIVPIETVAPGDVLEHGGYALEIVDLSGHTRGQIGLWHAATKTLFCGDHVLGKVSPNISAWDLENDYVGLYMDRLRYAKNLGPARLLAAHGAAITSPAGRIEELLAHHTQRLALMEELVRKANGPTTAYQVATQMEWSKNKDFYGLPAQQKWFATSETLAHLLALDRQGRVRYTQKNEALLFTV